MRLRSELNGSSPQPRRARGLLLVPEAALVGEDDQRGLGRVAEDRPAASRRARAARRCRAAPPAAARRARSGSTTSPADRKRPKGSYPAPSTVTAPAGVQTRSHGHLVLGQRPGLVGADDRRLAERLDRRQPPDERVALAPCAASPAPARASRSAAAPRGRGRRSRRSRTGSGRSGSCPTSPARRKKADADRDRQDGHEPRHPVELALERAALAPRLLRQRGDAAEPRRHAGRGDDRLGRPGGHVGAGEDRARRARRRTTRPVSADSSTRRSAADDQVGVGRDAVARRRAAARRPARPPRRRSRPPAPSRRTRTRSGSIRRSAATARSARCSWTKRRSR